MTSLRAHSANTSVDTSTSMPHTQEPAVGIVGLGLIGGSFAKAYARAGWRVFAENRTHAVVQDAMEEGVVSAPLDAETLSLCSLVIVALYPQAALSWLREHASQLPAQAVVIDVGGVKRLVCDEAFPLAQAHGFHFVGAHPMAGLHYSGYTAARAGLYQGQPCVLVPAPDEHPRVVEKLESMLDVCGFAHYALASAAEHDRRIAYTSQLAHVLSSAFIKSPRAMEHVGFSAGSFKDLTRVAQLNAHMWTELFLENADNLEDELDILIMHLQEYKQAIAKGDAETLLRLLDEGTHAKLETLALEQRLMGSGKQGVQEQESSDNQSFHASQETLNNQSNPDEQGLSQ